MSETENRRQDPGGSAANVPGMNFAVDARNVGDGWPELREN